MTNTFKTVEELDAKIAKNQPVILNQVVETKSKAEVKQTQAKTNLSELEQRIINVLNLIEKAKPAGVYGVYYELNKNYPNEYTNKQVTNKMWAMEKKHILGKRVESGVYYIESATLK